MTILIIDDDRDLCLLLKIYFLRKNYEVTIVYSFCDALPLAKGIQPDIVFLKTAICQNPEEDVRKLKQEVPYAEIVLDKYTTLNEY